MITSIRSLIHFQRLRCYSQFSKLNNYNVFNVFDIKNEFSINEEHLAKTFKSMQMLYHPDKTAKLDQESKDTADYNSSLINHAYQTLKDPYKRGLHLLNLNNLSIDEDESTKNLSADFLMDINEQINEKRKASDDLRVMLSEMDKEKDKILKLINQNFQAQKYEEAKKYLIKLNFYNNVTRKIIDLLD